MDKVKSVKGFPNPFVPRSVKDSPEYGLAFAKAIEKVSKNQYFVERNKRFKVNSDFARGEQPIQPYLDWMNIDGKKPHIFLDYTTSPIGKKLIDTVVSKYMGIDEEIRATAIDIGSFKRKEQDIKEAKYRMEYKDHISELSQMSGAPMEDENAFTPQTQSELELYKDVLYKTRDEIIIESALNVIFNNNDKIENKRILLYNLCVNGIAATRSYIDADGMIRYRPCLMPNLVYSYSSRNGFNDLWWVGEYMPMKISEIRHRWGNKISEDKLYEIAVSCRGKFGNPIDYLSPDIDRWGMRQYDDFSCMVLDFCYKTSIEKNYVKRYSSTGKESVDPVNEPIKETDSKKNVVSYDKVVYQGYFLVGTDMVMDYGIAKNMAKPNSKRSEVKLPYSIYMYDNVEMRNKSMMEMAAPIIRQLDLTYLKLQQIIAKARPSGVVIDITSLEEIDLGLGGVLTPLEIQEVYDQTGNLYYRSISTDEDRRVPVPITPIVNDIMNNVNSVIKTWEFQSERLREYLGLNEYVDSSSINPRVGKGVVESQVAASNNAIRYIWDAYTNIFERTAGFCALKFWDDIIFNPKSEYIDVIGEDNVQYIKENRNDLVDVDFNLKLESVASDEEKQLIESDIQAALNNQLIDLKDAREIRSIKNYKLANLYLDVARDKKRQRDIEDARQKSHDNANIQAQAAQSAAQSQEKAEQVKIQAGSMVEEVKGQNHILQSNFEFIQKVILDCLNTGRNLPPFLAPIVDIYLRQIVQPNPGVDQEVIQQAMSQGQPQDQSQGQDQQLTPDQQQQLLQLMQGQQAA